MSVFSDWLRAVVGGLFSIWGVTHLCVVRCHSEISTSIACGIIITSTVQHGRTCKQVSVRAGKFKKYFGMYLFNRNIMIRVRFLYNLQCYIF